MFTGYYLTLVKSKRNIAMYIDKHNQVLHAGEREDEEKKIYTVEIWNILQLSFSTI